MSRAVLRCAAPAWALVMLQLCCPRPSARAQDVDEEEHGDGDGVGDGDQGWFSLYLGSASGHDHPYQLELDVQASRGAVSQRVGAAVPLADLFALEVEWGLALANRPGASVDRAWALGNPYVGVQTILGTFGVSVASGDPYLGQQGDRLVLHRGGQQPWLFMHHQGALVYDAAVRAEVGHPLYGRLVVEMRFALAFLKGAGELGEDVGYVGTTMDAFYQLGAFRIGLEQHVATFDGERTIRSHEGYLGLDLDGLEARVGLTRASSDDGEGEWIGGLSIGGSFD